MTEPLVTVGIPTFNRPEGLARALASIRSQTYQHLEIIVSDNASTDPAVGVTVDKFAAKDERIHYHRHPENLGAMRQLLVVAAESAWRVFYVGSGR